MKFTQQENQIIRDSIEFRRQHSDGNTDHIKKIDSILAAIDSSLMKLNANQKAILSGCTKELVIYPNEELLRLSDYDVFLSKGQFLATFNLVDIGLTILRKLNDEYYKNFRLFKSVTDKIQSFSKINTVYYSLSGDKIYKAGVVIAGKSGLKIETAYSEYSKFEIAPFYQGQFMYEGRPSEIIDRLAAYEENNRLEENHKRLRTILEMGAN